MTQEQDRLKTPEVREQLVQVAEKAAEALLPAKNKRGQSIPEKTQMSRLLSVARGAFCGAEIRNYLRYQAAREVWPKDETDRLIRDVEKILSDEKLEGRDQVRAWELFSGYLTRAYVYLTAGAEG